MKADVQPVRNAGIRRPPTRFRRGPRTATVPEVRGRGTIASRGDYWSDKPVLVPEAGQGVEAMAGPVRSLPARCQTLAGAVRTGRGGHLALNRSGGIVDTLQRVRPGIVRLGVVRAEEIV